MDEEQQQISRQYSFQVITLPDTIPPSAPDSQNQATMQCGSAIHPSPGMSHNDILVPNTIPPVPPNQATMPPDSAIHPAPTSSRDVFVSPPGAHPAYYEQPRVGYAPFYGPVAPNDGTTYIYPHAPYDPQPTNQLNNIAVQPGSTATAIANEPPFSDMRMPESTSAPSGRRLKRTRQDLKDTEYNYPAVPGTSIANTYRDLAMRFINDPQSKIIVIRMESSAGRSRVVIELEIVDAA